ncbi:MAG: three-Cys-motif partner protein TcmP [Candidatus Paceibacterota bacterium]
MGSKDLHIKPFDEATITKLSLFEDYTESWIPTFVMTPRINQIHIFDLFAGPGYDKDGLAGSPIRILNKVKDQIGIFFQQKTRVIIHLNEFNKDKFESLVEHCGSFLSSNPKLKHILNMEYYSEDAADLLPKLLPVIKAHPSLVFFDQNGVKFISREYLEEMERLSTTDFLFFVSSSYFKRLGLTPEFQKVIPFTEEELADTEWSNIHRVVVEKLRSYLKPNSKLRLYPFSIKKGANIYGLIFGASHPAAVNKFLTMCWKKNRLNGEANFDIHKDKEKAQAELFGNNKLTKVEQFKIDLKDKIINGDIRNNFEALDYTFATGNYYKYANNALKELKKEGIVKYDGSTPGINYSNVIKKRNRINYKLN